MKRPTRIGKWTIVWLCLPLLCTPIALAARERSDEAPQALQEMWAKLDDARDYRCQPGAACPLGGAGSVEVDRCKRKGYSQLLQDYRDDTQTSYGVTPETLFLELAELSGQNESGFELYLGDPLWDSEARWGLQETLNELMLAQLTQGNEKLLQGLRTRFPGTGDPADLDQLTLLTQSVADFESAARWAFTALRGDPTALRARDDVVPTLPFWVENAGFPDGAPPVQAEVVESDLHRLTELVSRRGVANNALGRRKFFFGNVTPAGRQAAADELKRSAQATYLNTALLGAIQSEQDFQNNNGYELKRRVVEAQKLFDDVLAGFNPLELLGDFVPRAETDDKIANAVSLMNQAKTSEGDAASFNRSYDEDQTALTTELQNQQIEFLDRVSTLTGISTPSLPDLTDHDERATFFENVDSELDDCLRGMGPCGGEIGTLALDILAAEIDSRAAQEVVRAIPERVRIEQERQGAVANVVLVNGIAQAVMTTAIQIASAFSVDASVPPGVTTYYGQIATAGIAGDKELLAAMEQATIEGINSAATVKNLLLEQVQALIAVERASLVIGARRAELDGARAELEQTVRNYVGAQQNLSCAYYSNPAYRLQQSQAQRNADLAFESAMVQSYFAAKSLEYEWAERLANPIQCSQPDCPRPIGQSALFNPITRAESVFASASAGSAGAAEPSLDTFLRALRQWDLDLRELRTVSNDYSPITYSMKRDILGFDFDDQDPVEVERSILRFRDFVAENRVTGTGSVDDLVFEFGMQAADQAFFPAEPNVKLESVELNLVPRSGFSVGGGSNAALASLVMRDIATLRTFFASYQTGDDDLLFLELEETKQLEASRFRALVSASIDGQYGSANIALANLSPAVSRWTLKIDMEQFNNRDLILENLADVELRLDFRSGAPPTFDFSGLD